jgi:hypothetical protein
MGTAAAAAGLAQGVVAPAPVAALAPSTASDPQQDAVELALAEAMGADPDSAALSDVVTMDASDPAAEIAALSSDTVTPTLRPRARPANIAGLAAPAAVAPVAEIDPAALTDGARLVQLGAFDTAEDARAEWGKLTNQYADLLSAKSLVVQSAESGGRTFFRLRAAGFDSEDEARTLCTALLERNASCIPVVHR